MKKILFVINLMEDTFFVTSLFVIGFVIIDVIVPENIIFFKNVISITCHQQPERCFFILNKPIALCARCLGIYLGFAVFYKSVNKMQYSLYLYYFSISYVVFNLVAELGLKLNGSNAIRFLFGLTFSFVMIKSVDLIRKYAVRQNFELRVSKAF